MEQRLVLFDVDGTLIDTAGAGRRAMERAFQTIFGLDGIAVRTTGVRFAGMTDPLILEAMAVALEVSRARFDARCAELQQCFLDALHEEMGRPDPRRRVMPGVRRLLDELKGRPAVHVGLVTGNLEQGARRKLEGFELTSYFAGGGFGSDHADRREIARIAWRRLSALAGVDFPRERVVVVGDTEHDVDCAKVNGFRAVAVDAGWVPRERLEASRPDVLLDGLEGLEAALEALRLRD